MKSAILITIICIASTTLSSTALEIDGSHAKAFYEQYNIAAVFDGLYNTTKRANGILKCAKVSIIGKDGYQCYFAVNRDSIPLWVGGIPAQYAYENFDVAEVDKDPFTTIKQKRGAFICIARTQGSAPATYWCAFH